MPTARDIITLSFKDAGVLGVGQSLLAEDVVDGLTYLRRMLALWQRKRWLVPMLYDLAMPGNGAISNKIGPGQYWNAARPDKIQSAYIIQLATGTTPVSLPCRIITAYENYAQIVTKNLNSLPYQVFYDGAYPFGNVFFWPIPDSQYELHLILKGNANWQQQISALEIVTPGTLYTDGAYVAVPLVGGSEGQEAATANITIAGGVVTILELQNPGQNYVINDFLTVDAANVGGTGSGFTCKVTNTTISLDSEFNMPEEYEEAIGTNLAIRLGAAYQTPVNADIKKLAKASLNTIKVANTQVAAMSMPVGISKGIRTSIYNPDYPTGA
jgi:hypothetical protein